jgi:PIN domain nuclease of toxin-antitoxin system
VLLDTHVWIWAVDGGARLGPRIRRQLDRLSRSTPGSLCVSAASAFEVAALHTAGRLQLTQPVERWIREALHRANLRTIAIDRDISIDAGLIPAPSLPDPVDRWLVATAREYEIPLVTADRRILDYAASTGLVRVVDARK